MSQRSQVSRVDVVKIGEIKVSVQKLCLKQGFLEDTNLDHLTSGWPGTHCFRGDANFDMFPKKYIHCFRSFSEDNSVN